jgi:hypothetical protein
MPPSSALFVTTAVRTPKHTEPNLFYTLLLKNIKNLTILKFLRDTSND